MHCSFSGKTHPKPSDKDVSLQVESLTRRIFAGAANYVWVERFSSYVRGAPVAFVIGFPLFAICIAELFCISWMLSRACKAIRKLPPPPESPPESPPEPPPEATPPPPQPAA